MALVKEIWEVLQGGALLEEAQWFNGTLNALTSPTAKNIS